MEQNDYTARSNNKPLIAILLCFNIMSAIAQDWNLQSIDDLTATLLIELQLEDTQEISSSFKGKAREGELSDAELAFKLYKQELDHNASILSDRRMTRSIARAVQSDGDILTHAMSLEQTAARDRDMACALSGSGISSNVRPWTVTAEEIDGELMSKLAALWMSPMEEFEGREQMLPLKHDVDATDEPITHGESSLWASTRPASSKTHYCTACQENKKFTEVVRAPCRHEYCRECLQDLFISSMTDESLFPPRCCKMPIALSVVRIFLTSDIVHKYQQKKIEFDTSDKTYCCSPHCSAFIRPDGIGGDCATCTECGILTCTICKSAVHEGDCPADIGLQQLLETATENGWQRCYNCHRLVELETGCNHMTLVHQPLLQPT
jgi:hypothetical protein